jgi:hypothetical protein
VALTGAQSREWHASLARRLSSSNDELGRPEAARFPAELKHMSS